jgi:transposase
VKEYLKKILGVDLTEVEGLDEKILMDIISVTGKDMSKWVTSQHFVSYLRLAPRPRISGGKKLGHENHKTTNPATLAFRQAAHSLANSKGSLGKLYRNLCIKKGKKTAKKAVARKLAVLFIRS